MQMIFCLSVRKIYIWFWNKKRYARQTLKYGRKFWENENERIVCETNYGVSNEILSGKNGEKMDAVFFSFLDK